MVMGDDAGIEAGSLYKKKLEYPVSIDESRYELRQRETLINPNPWTKQTSLPAVGRVTLTVEPRIFFL